MDKMKMILALLTAKFPGVRKDGLNMLARLMALQTETEDEAKAAVERLTRDGVDAFVRDFRSDVERRKYPTAHARLKRISGANLTLWKSSPSLAPMQTGYLM